MKNRLDALEGDRLFDELHFGAEAKGEEIEASDNSDYDESDKASESEEIVSDGDSENKHKKGSKKVEKEPEVDPTDEFWNQNKKVK